MLATLLAIGWEPWLRGVLTVMIGAAVWMGSIYLIHPHGGTCLLYTSDAADDSALV